VKDALTFDDVLLVPARSEVLPKDTDVSSFIAPDETIKLPICSAAMDTVSDSTLSIAIAREGGIGFIHKNMSIEEQAAAVRKVKRSESHTIENPITLSPHQKLADAVEIMRTHHISGLPVVENGKIVGILTNRDMRFVKDMSTPVTELMTKEVITAPEGITMTKAQGILQKNRIEKLPVVNTRGELKGLITVRDIEIRIKYPNANKDVRGRLKVGGAVGISRDSMERVDELVKANVDILLVDTAHGFSKNVIDLVKEIKGKHDLPLVAGNIATADGADALIDAGADAVKVGIGPGSICTTRIVTGVGVPQITAIMDCAAVARKRGKVCIADGGIKYSGDISKAIAAGADVVMIGSLFAGTEESPGETILYEGRTFKAYRGMGSISAMSKGSSDRYYQENVDREELIPQGIEGMVPYKGSLSKMIYQLVGGLRAGMGFCGVSTIRQMQTNAGFMKVTPASVSEGHPHSVTITKESPNYFHHRNS